MRRTGGGDERERWRVVPLLEATLVTVVIVMGSIPLYAENDQFLVAQMGAMRSESIPHSHKTSSRQQELGAVEETKEGKKDQQAYPPSIGEEGGLAIGYDPAGRRDPFMPVIQEVQSEKVDENLPPLQRVALTELSLIAVVWGAHGYVAMVQTPDGHGYTIRRGTRIGQNNGVVSAITERGIIVQERITDVYGRKQEREIVKLLHPKEGLE
ncbi:MAG: pilus assembly protein PilP [Nitrospira sp.]|nr:pilus assembly protein PilP [Nitrospira sp.]